MCLPRLPLRQDGGRRPPPGRRALDGTARARDHPPRSGRASRRLAAAISARDIGALRRAWPGITPELEREWLAFLSSDRNSDVAARVRSVGKPRLEGEGITVPFDLELGYTTAAQGRVSKRARFAATFVRGSGWILTGIRATD